jgi:hypothetical protein
VGLFVSGSVSEEFTAAVRKECGSVYKLDETMNNTIKRAIIYNYNENYMAKTTLSIETGLEAEITHNYTREFWERKKKYGEKVQEKMR